MIEMQLKKFSFSVPKIPNPQLPVYYFLPDVLEFGVGGGRC